MATPQKAKQENMANKYNETRVNFQTPIVDTEGNPVLDEKQQPTAAVETNRTEKQFNTAVAEATTKKTPAPEPLKIQTFVYTEVSHSGELLEVLGAYNSDPVAAEKVAVDIINRGLVLRQQTAIRDFMIDEDQPAVEGVYDPMTDAAKPGEGRRKADPKSKAAKQLSELLGFAVDAAKMDEILAAFAAAK